MTEFTDLPLAHIQIQHPGERAKVAESAQESTVTHGSTAGPKVLSRAMHSQNHDGVKEGNKS